MVPSRFGCTGCCVGCIMTVGYNVSTGTIRLGCAVVYRVANSAYPHEMGKLGVTCYDHGQYFLTMCVAIVEAVPG